jgi:predicted phosphodiesterase
MKIHLLSDLHTEFWQGGKTAKLEALVRPADVLVLAGDIGVGRQNVRDVLKHLAPHYKDIIYIPGNHEYYGGLEFNGFNDFSQFGSKLPSNVHFFNPGSFILNDVTFIVGTLWTNFREDPLAELDAQRGIVDFRRIPDATPARMKGMFYHHSQYFKMAYEHRDPSKPVVFVSHFLPAVDCISPQWRDKDAFSSSLNKYFANDMGGWIETLDCATWLFGHTHDAVDVQIGTTRCLARPMGYPAEHQQPYEHLIIEV